MKRIQQLQKKLVDKKLDALLVTNPYNIRYLTGFAGVAPQEREAYTIITQKDAYILTSKLYPKWLVPRSSSRNEVGLKGIELNHDNKLPTLLKKIAQKENLKRIGFEETDLTVGELKKIQSSEFRVQNIKKRLKFTPTKNLVENLRMIKDDDEIASIKKAAKLTDETFTYIVDFLKTKKLNNQITEQLISWEIEKFIKERGAKLAFSPIVAFGKNSANPHHVPTTNYELQAKHTSKSILLDFGAKVDGYCADMTRMIFVGKPTQKQKKVYKTVLKAQESAFKYLASTGRSCLEASGKKVDEIARNVLKKAKLAPYPHSLGHGVGLEIHEGFRLSYKKDFMIKPGMVFTIEPGIYENGWGGIRIEDLVLFTRNGIEILTQSDNNLVVL